MNIAQVIDTADIHAAKLLVRADEREGGSTAMMLLVKAYVDEHFADNSLSLTALSGVFGVNERMLSRLFKLAFGLNFIDYVIELRIDKARRLLSESAFPVDDIANQVGYASPISFRRTFKRLEGISPGEYRKRWKREPGINTFFDKGGPKR